MNRPPLLAGAADRLLAPVPAERLAAARLLIGGYGVTYLLVRTPHLVDLANLPASRWQAAGVLGAMPARPPGALAGLVLAATLAAGVGFVAGWHWRLCGPAFAAGALTVTSYGASFGHALHTENLLVLHLVVLCASPAAAAWSVDARRRRHRGGRTAPEPPAPPPPAPAPPPPPRRVLPRAPAPPTTAPAPPAPAPAGRYGLPLRLAALVTVLTYAIAGWAKLRYGGSGWLTGEILRHQVAYDNLRKVVFGDPWSPLGTWLVGRSWIWPPLAWATLAVELGAPLALLRRRWSYTWAAAAWLFHLGTLAVMAILFPYPLSGVAFAPLLPLERLARRLRLHRLGRSGTPTAAWRPRRRLATVRP